MQSCVPSSILMHNCVFEGTRRKRLTPQNGVRTAKRVVRSPVPLFASVPRASSWRRGRCGTSGTAPPGSTGSPLLGGGRTHAPWSAPLCCPSSGAAGRSRLRTTRSGSALSQSHTRMCSTFRHSRSTLPGTTNKSCCASIRAASVTGSSTTPKRSCIPITQPPYAVSPDVLRSGGQSALRTTGRCSASTPDPSCLSCRARQSLQPLGAVPARSCKTPRRFQQVGSVGGRKARCHRIFPSSFLRKSCLTFHSTRTGRKAGQPVNSSVSSYVPQALSLDSLIRQPPKTPGYRFD